MTSGADHPEFVAHLSLRRLASAVAAGVLVGAGAAAVLAWQAAVLLGWCTAAAVYLVRVWRVVLRPEADAEWTARHATRIDESRVAADIGLLAAAVASLAAVGVLLLKAGDEHGAAEAFYTGLGVASVLVSWAVVHTLFALRYAHTYYGSGGGLNFHGEHPPTYRDFAYVAFTIGMTYQVSDTEVNARRMRGLVMRHALISFLFGTAIIALMINVVASLAR